MTNEFYTVDHLWIEGWDDTLIGFSAPRKADYSQDKVSNPYVLIYFIDPTSPYDCGTYPVYIYGERHQDTVQGLPRYRKFMGIGATNSDYMLVYYLESDKLENLGKIGLE